MNVDASLWGALRRGCYPHQLSWLIDNPVRRLFIRPQTLADRLPLSRQSRILEVGPGSGYFSRELAGRVPEGHLELLDVQPEMLVKAIRKFGGTLPHNVTVTTADASAPLPHEDSSVDVVVLVAALGELPSPQAALRSFLRILRSSGILAVHEHLPDPDFISFRKLVALAEAGGFEFIQRWGGRWNFTAVFKKPNVAGWPGTFTSGR